MVVQFKKFNVKSNLEHKGTKLNFGEACKLLGLCYITFYAIFQNSEIPHERRGKKFLFQIEDLLDYMEDHKVGDWSKVSPEDILDEDKVDIKGACQILDGMNYKSFYDMMQRKNFPRFQYNSKIVFYKSLILKYKESCKRLKWSKEQA